MHLHFCTRLRCWWLALVVGALMIISASVLVLILPYLTKLIINEEVALKEGSKSFDLWKNPPITPQLHLYIYNVTNSRGFLDEGEKPALQELGPYVYLEKWEKVNVKINDNDTLSYNLRKTFIFSEELSSGSEEDFVIVPNVTMLSITSKLKDAERWSRRAMADDLCSEPFVNVTVRQLLWGYDEPLLDMVRMYSDTPDSVPDKFGLLYGKNGTKEENYTIFAGVQDATRRGLLDKFNGESGRGHWPTAACDSVMGTDGSIFPAHITKQTVLKVFEKDLCRLMPFVYEQDVVADGGVPAFRFTPPRNVFSSPNRDPTQKCYASAEPPYVPEGLFNISLCQNDSPLLLSFPHFYLADPTLREAVTGISAPDAEKHQSYIDVNPTVGVTLRARARMQVNLAVSHVKDIKSVAYFPDIVFPLMWFEDRIDGLPEDVTSLIKISVELPAAAEIAIPCGLAAFGSFILIGALICLSNSENQQDKLRINDALPVNSTKKVDNLTQNPSVLTEIV